MNKRTLALTTACGLAVPGLLLVATPAAQADVDRVGACGTGTYELSVDREGRGFEVSVDLDGLAPGSTWRVVVRQDGKRIANVVRTAERDGDLDVERFARNTAGKDTFRFTAKRVGGSASCGATVRI